MSSNLRAENVGDVRLDQAPSAFFRYVMINCVLLRFVLIAGIRTQGLPCTAEQPSTNRWYHSRQ